jgi:SAM-dependent methyltransferase
VVGVDFSEVAATAAQRRAKELAAACRCVVAEVPGVPLRGECADFVYAGKGALIWMRDLAAWASARDAARLLRPTGHLFIHEARRTVPLWTRQGGQHCRSELAAGDFPGLSVPTL